MKNPLVKICGITRLEDAQAAVDAGADFLGFVFVARSKRAIAPAAAAAIASALRGQVQFVGVFVDERVETINAIAESVGLDLVQLHGSESDAVCAAIRRPVIKAIRVGSGVPAFTFPSAAWALYDTRLAGAQGGTGQTFDWEMLAAASPHRPFFLAGGLRVGNVFDAVRILAPDAVDVSSGVESAPGIKDHEMVRTFIERIRQS